jgi:hypothetical protein
MMGNILRWILTVCVFFGLVYACALTFVYVEGDDATSIAYHALGRIAAIQPPYAPYHSMMDTLLSLLPSDEATLRYAAVGATAAAALLLCLLILIIACEWAPIPMQRLSWRAPLIVMLAAPELFYLGLVYSPSVVALCLEIAAHLLLRKSMRHYADVEGGRPAWALLGGAASLMLFALGASARWDTLAYGLVIVTDVVFFWPKINRALPLPAPRSRLIIAGLWGVLAIVGWLAAVMLTGHSPREVLETISSHGPVEHFSLVATVTRIQPLLTPALLLCFGAGIIRLVRSRDPLCMILVASLIPVIPVLPQGVPKWFIIAVPVLITVGLSGFDFLWGAVKPGMSRAVVQMVLLTVLLIPWMIGVRITYNDTAWGPAFEIREYDRSSDERFSASLHWGAGSAVPTPEGPRPLFGHAYTLFGGAWRVLVAKEEQERMNSIHRALNLRLPLLQDRGEGFAVALLARMQFRTVTLSQWSARETLPFIERRFSSSDQGLLLVRLTNRDMLYDPSSLHMLRSRVGDRVMLYGYPATLRRLYKLAPEALEKLGTTSAVLRVDRLELQMKRDEKHRALLRTTFTESAGDHIRGTANEAWAKISGRS